MKPTLLMLLCGKQNFIIDFMSIRKKEGKWFSVSLVKTSKPSSDIVALPGVWIKGADDLFITVSKIHHSATAVLVNNIVRLYLYKFSIFFYLIIATTCHGS